MLGRDGVQLKVKESGVGSWKTMKVENKPSSRVQFLNNNDIKSDSEEYKYRCSVQIYYPVTL